MGFAIIACPICQLIGSYTPIQINPHSKYAYCPIHGYLQRDQYGFVKFNSKKKKI